MALPVLAIKPEFVLEAEDAWHVTETAWQEGAQHTQVVGERVRRWRMVLRHATTAERAAVLAMWDAVRGGAGVFAVEVAEEGTVAVRFDTDAMGSTRLSAIATAMELPLVEALNHDG